MDENSKKRGSYAKGVRRREEILETALEVIARDGYDGATIKKIADAVGLSTTGVLHYFGSREALLREIVRRRDQEDRIVFPADATSMQAFMSGLAELLRHNAAQPGLVRLYSNLSADATAPEHDAHEFFRERYRQAREIGTGLMQRLQAQHKLNPALDPADAATAMIALIEGLQILWQYDPSIDMAALTETFGALTTAIDQES